jgi:hypothetical protein
VKKKEEMHHPVGLCHRCEYRAEFKEVGTKPRYECGTDASVYSCYMYQPVKPLVLKKDEGDRRPLFPAFVSARVHAIGLPKVYLRFIKERRAFIFYWEPKGEKE